MATALAPTKCIHIGPDWRVNDDCHHVYSVELKIGIARGIFLADLATRYPRSFFIGVEINGQSALLAEERLLSSSIQNAKVVHAEAIEFIKSDISDGSIDTLHVYHPTPYPGALGLEQRLVGREFAEEAYRILRNWGVLQIATDDYRYYRFATRHFESARWWSVPWQLTPLALERGCVVGSTLEQRHRAEGTTTLYTAQLI